MMLVLSLLALSGSLCACGSLRFKGAADGSAGHGSVGVTPASGGAALRGGGPYISGGGGPPPSLSELRAFLDAELQRLGKAGSAGLQTGNPVDVSVVGAGLAPPSQGGMNAAPTRAASAAPTGQDNAVFDLSAVPVDENGDSLTPQDISGGAVVSAIKLTWTEQLIGDYDQNGEVNVGDLTPLAQHWEKTVVYDDPSLHGGFDAWPSGSPDDAPTGLPAANNWRLARVDGDSNSEINMADITPIAVHWQEALSGYRVYRKGSGESNFTALADGGASAIGAAELSLEQPTVSVERPLRYLFTDADAPTLPGAYLYYCAPLDKLSGNEGPASGVVSIDLATGVVNQAPIAKLKVSPGFAGAPAPVTLDATGSYDPDGSVAELEWDIDADGNVDLLATDATPPALSSSGEVTGVDTAAPGGAWPPPIVTGTYTQGHPEWLYPRVRAIDDEGLAGAWQTAQLGISGWVLEKLYDETERAIDFEVNSVYPGAVTRDPVTGEAVIVGTNNNDAVPTAPEGLYIAWREGPGQWRQERILAYDNPVWQIDADHRYGLAMNPRVLWISAEPVVAFVSSEKGADIVWLASKLDLDNWHMERLPTGFLGIENGNQISSAHSATLVMENGANASPADWWVLDIDDSGWSLSATGYTSSGFPELDASPPWGIASLDGTLIAVLPYNTAFTTSQIPILSETDAAPWQLSAADAGELAGHSFACIDVQITPSGEWYLCALSDSASTSTYAVNSLALISGHPGNFMYTQVRDYILQYKSCYLFVDGLSATMFSVDSSGIPETNGFNSIFYDRLEPQGQLSETIFRQGQSDSLFLGFRCGFSFQNGGAFCTLEHGDKKQGGADETDLGIRVDPRF